MKIAKEIPNYGTSNNLGVNVLYLIATLPDEQKEKELKKAPAIDVTNALLLYNLNKKTAITSSDRLYKKHWRTGNK